MNRLAWLAVIALLSPACGGGGGNNADGGGDSDPPDGGDTGPIRLDGDPEDGDPPDGDPPDGDPPVEDLPTCSDPLELTGETSASFDTSEAPPGTLSLGADCGNPDAPTPSPQAVIEYTVPGDSETAVSFSTINGTTDDMFDTVIQVRRGTCEEAPTTLFPRSCFDDTDPQNNEFRSTGVVQATGGDVLYFIVTGYTGAGDPFSDRGTVKIEFSTAANTPPVLSSASLVGVRGDAVLTVAGTDAESNVEGFLITLLDSSDAIIDLNGDEVGDDEDRFVDLFDTESGIPGESPFNGTIYLPIAAELRELGAAKANIAVFDAASATSAEIEATLTYTGAHGEACASEEPFCGSGTECMSSICEWSAAVTSACSGATTLTVATPTTTTTTTTASGTTLNSGDSNFEGSCVEGMGGTAGPELVYTVAVPAGSFDLVARTNVDGTDVGSDTVVYIRSECVNPAAESACADDIEMGDLRSSAIAENAAEGTYAVFVEEYGGDGAVAFTLSVGLRPVLASGATCDTDEIENRCADGACASGTCP